MSKVLLDTNVLIYSIDEESKYFKKAQNLISEQNRDLFTTSKNLSEFLPSLPDSQGIHSH